MNKVSMEVELLLFGITKDILGGAKYKLPVSEPCTVGDLKNQLLIEFPKLKELNSLLVAINSEYGQDDQVINSNDEIALIPPVSGG